MTSLYISHAVFEEKGKIVFHLLHQIKCLLMIVFRFTTKSGDHVCREGNIRHVGADILNQSQIIFNCVSELNKMAFSSLN